MKGFTGSGMRFSGCRKGRKGFGFRGWQSECLDGCAF